MWNSWAIYGSIVIIVFSAAGAYIGRKRDKRDEANMEKIKKKQKKIYVNLFLEPIVPIQQKKQDGLKRNKSVAENYQKVNT